MEWTASLNRQALILFKNELNYKVIWTGVDLSLNPFQSSLKKSLEGNQRKRDYITI